MYFNKLHAVNSQNYSGLSLCTLQIGTRSANRFDDLGIAGSVSLRSAYRLLNISYTTRSYIDFRTSETSIPATVASTQSSLSSMLFRTSRTGPTLEHIATSLMSLFPTIHAFSN